MRHEYHLTKSSGISFTPLLNYFIKKYIKLILKVQTPCCHDKQNLTRVVLFCV
jgi:hypothetical protein